jgi:uncharacterized membrane protein HdeD (DUF308 family)
MVKYVVLGIVAVIFGVIVFFSVPSNDVETCAACFYGGLALFFGGFLLVIIGLKSTNETGTGGGGY